MVCTSSWRSPDIMARASDATISAGSQRCSFATRLREGVPSMAPKECAAAGYRRLSRQPSSNVYAGATLGNIEAQAAGAMAVPAAGRWAGASRSRRARGGQTLGHSIHFGMASRCGVAGVLARHARRARSDPFKDWLPMPAPMLANLINASGDRHWLLFPVLPNPRTNHNGAPATFA